MQLNSESRPLWARVRQIVIRMTLGVALIAPAASMAGNRFESAAERAARPADESPLKRTWAEAERVLKAQLRQQERLEQELFEGAQAGVQEVQVASLAAEFSIPVPLAEEIHEAALEEHIAPRMAFGLVRAESSFRPRVVSPVGAVGLTQLLPSTARWLEPGTTRNELMESKTNLRIGFRYLRHLIDKYGDSKLGLTAYNRGPGTVSKLIARGKNPDNGYAEKVLTGSSTRHVRLMNAKFGSRSIKKPVRTTRKG